MNLIEFNGSRSRTISINTTTLSEPPKVLNRSHQQKKIEKVLELGICDVMVTFSLYLWNEVDLFKSFIVVVKYTTMFNMRRFH